MQDGVDFHIRNGGESFAMLVKFAYGGGQSRAPTLHTIHDLLVQSSPNGIVTSAGGSVDSIVLKENPNSGSDPKIHLSLPWFY